MNGNPKRKSGTTGRWSLSDLAGGFSGMYYLAILIMIPIAFVAWGLIQAVVFITGLTMKDNPEIIIICTFVTVALACAGSVIWSNRAKIKRKRAERKAVRKRAEEDEEPWNAPPEKMPWE